MDKYLMPYEYQIRQFPEVNPTVFRQSARQFNRLITDANRILNEVSASEEFARKIMDAAQRSDYSEVERLIVQLGIESSLEVSFSPESLRLILRQLEGAGNCCILNLGIRWL